MEEVWEGRTIDWVDGCVVIIDQTQLPDREEILRLRTGDELVAAIDRLAVRGAMALGVAGAMGVALAALRAQERQEPVGPAIDRAARALTATRPTAVNLAWGVGRALAARSGGAEAIVEEALRLRDQDVEANRQIGERGADVLAGRKRVLTHCNAGALAGVEYGTALSALRVLHGRGSLTQVLVCETRPLMQGARLTAWELARMGIDHRVIIDSAGAGLILTDRVDAVVVGADRIARNGDVANKVGTLSHALAAARAGIPFVVAAPESTLDPNIASGSDIPIEERDPDEVLVANGKRTVPAGTAGLNPAFDVTPADLVSAIVTESRVVRPASGEALHPLKAVP